MKIGNRELKVKSWKSVGVLLLFIIVLIAACKDETEPLISDYNYDYFPLKIGKYWVYEVDSIYFSEGTSGIRKDTVKIQAREAILDRFVDEKGDTIYKVERYERKQANESWKIKKVFTLNRNRTQAIRTEDNLRFVKLTFPLDRNSRWTSTAFVPDGLSLVFGSGIEVFKYWQSSVEALDEPQTLGNLKFDKTALVMQANRKNIITEYRVVKEVYAKGIGLVESEWLIYNTQCNVCCKGTGSLCMSLPWEQKAESGFLFRQRLVEYI